MQTVIKCTHSQSLKQTHIVNGYCFAGVCVFGYMFGCKISQIVLNIGDVRPWKR